mgnify:CR=1 FL=1
MAYDNFRRQIEVLEHNGIDDINLPTQYASLAQCALELDMPDSAFVALQKAAALPKRTTYQEFTVNKGFGLYYIRCGNFAEAEKRLEASEELFRRDPSLRFHTAGLRYLQMTYFKASGQYGRALKTILETQRDTVVRSSGYNNYVLTKELGDIYWHLRRMEQAAVNYREYIRLSDSVRNREIRTATDDFSGILEISRLHNETKELQYDLQCKRLRNTYLIICLLGGVLVTGGVGYARMVKLNRRLKASEATVLAQNEHLRISGEELLKAKEQAEQASRMKGVFIRNITHEINTPLNSIVGFAELAAAPDADDEERQSYIEIIRENSGYLQKLVDDVLYIAGLESSDTPPALGPVDINVCCMQCIQTVRDYSLRKLDIRFEPECAQLPVNTSCLLLSKALTELLRNAARFAPDGRITLAYTLISHKKRIAFTVTDRGPGIPAAEADRIFDRFVKLDPFSQGMGLGLAVCRLIADALGGGVELDTSYTEGARFTLTIPIV